MNLAIALLIAAGGALCYTAGRVRGEYIGTRLVVDNIRSLGRHFTAREVVIGCSIPWTAYTHHKTEAPAPVGAGAGAEALLKPQAEVIVKHPSTYRHPFLNQETYDA